VIYRIALALHPSYRLEYFEKIWFKKQTWIKDCKRATKEYYEKYVREFEATNPTNINTNNDAASSFSEDEFEAFSKREFKSRRTKRPRIQSEWDRFHNNGIPEADSHVKNPIRWWWNRRFEYPVLFHIAMDIFSIPAMSSECERVFSQLRRLITFERTRLGDLTIESDECQKHWISSGCLDLKDSDDEAEESQGDDPDDEEALGDASEVEEGIDQSTILIE